MKNSTSDGDRNTFSHNIRLEHMARLELIGKDLADVGTFCSILACTDV